MAGIASPSLPLRSQTTFRRCVFHLSRFPDVFGEQILSGACSPRLVAVCITLPVVLSIYIRNRDLICSISNAIVYFSSDTLGTFPDILPSSLLGGNSECSHNLPVVHPQSVFLQIPRQYQLTFVLPLKRPLSAKCRSHSLFGVAFFCKLPSATKQDGFLRCPAYHIWLQAFWQGRPRTLCLFTGHKREGQCFQGTDKISCD